MDIKLGVISIFLMLRVDIYSNLVPFYLREFCILLLLLLRCLFICNVYVYLSNNLRGTNDILSYVILNHLFYPLNIVVAMGKVMVYLHP